MPNQKEPSSPERVFPLRPEPKFLKYATIKWKALHTKEDVEHLLAEMIHLIHDQGFFISGSISIDDKRLCGDCGCQMIWMPQFQQHRCPRCMALVIQAAEANGHVATTDVANRASALSDSKICPGCGGLCIRTGTCYTCQNCGTNEGCG